MDDFIASLAMLPIKTLPNGHPHFPSFNHDKKVDAFVRKKRREDKHFNRDEAREVYDKYTHDATSRFLRAKREALERDGVGFPNPYQQYYDRHESSRRGTQKVSRACPGWP